MNSRISSAIPPKLWAIARAAKAWLHQQSFRKREVDTIYGGHSMRLLIADGLGEAWYGNSNHGLPEIDFLRSRGLEAGARIFDCGAHQAVVALVIAKEVGAQGQVVAIEPNRENVRIALRNRELNGASQLEIVEAAVGDKAGTIEINTSGNAQVDRDCGRYGCATVTCVTVDGLATTYGMPDLVFVDVEGFECAVLRGAQSVLNAKKAFFVEVHARCGLEKLGGSVAEVFAFFSGDVYELWTSDDANPRPVPWSGELPASRVYLFAIPR